MLKEFYICCSNVQLKIFYWQIFVKTAEGKELLSETLRINLASGRLSALKRNCGTSQAQSCLSWPTFSSHGEAVLGRDAEMICLFPLCGKEKKHFWLQYCDSAIVEGGIDYPVCTSQVRVTMNWRWYQAWVRKCRRTGVLLITDKRKDCQAWSMNECVQYQRLPICAASYS